MGNRLIDRTGEENYNYQGCLMKIVEYNNFHNLKVEFQDEFKTKINSAYHCFNSGSIRNPNFRLGELNYNNDNCLMKIINYTNDKNITVEFQDKFKAKVNTRYNCFQKGEVKNPYFPNRFDIAYIGRGDYRAVINKSITIQYQTWDDMLKRCYDKKFHHKQPTYKDCSVCEEWHNFQTFAKWHDENYYILNNEKIQLDKDILAKNNKIYSPDTCIFVPERINSLFGRKSRKIYPIGVRADIKTTKYISRVRIKDERTYLGQYDTAEEAFCAYKEAKEQYIKEVADEYKNKYPQFPQKLYEAMYNYEVEIDD